MFRTEIGYFFILMYMMDLTRIPSIYSENCVIFHRICTKVYQKKTTDIQNTNIFTTPVELEIFAVAIFSLVANVSEDRKFKTILIYTFNDNFTRNQRNEHRHVVFNYLDFQTHSNRQLTRGAASVILDYL